MQTLSGMKARGYYDAHSSLQAESFAWASEWLLHAIASMSLPNEDEAIHVADFGCSTGGNSIVEMGVIVDALRQVRPSQHVEVTHNDLPSNDFNSLCATLWNPEHENYFQARGKRRSNVSARLAPSSFYAPVLPPRSLHIGTSLLALEWLSQPIPGTVRDQICPMDAPADVLERNRERCVSDLGLFLRYRAEEMVEGGQLLIVYPGRADFDYTVSGGFRALNHALREAVREGRIDQTRYDSVFIPAYQPTLDDVRAGAQSAAGQWIVKRCEMEEIPIGFVEEFRRDGDANTYAARSAALVRAFTEPVVASAILPLEGDPGLIDHVYETMSGLMAASPEDHPMRNFAVAALLERRS